MFMHIRIAHYALASSLATHTGAGTLGLTHLLIAKTDHPTLGYGTFHSYISVDQRENGWQAQPSLCRGFPVSVRRPVLQPQVLHPRINWNLTQNNPPNNPTNNPQIIAPGLHATIASRPFFSTNCSSLAAAPLGCFPELGDSHF